MDEGLSEIHVPSGPSSGYQKPADLDGLSLRQLVQRKDNLEAELKALGAVLDSHGVDMQTSPHRQRWLSSLRHRCCPSQSDKSTGGQPAERLERADE